MPELTESSYQVVLTEGMGSWYRTEPRWSASDELANASFRTAGRGLADPPLQIRILVQPPLPSEPIQAAIRQASALVRLPGGWNSYRAKPVSSEAIRGAIAFLIEAAAVVPDVVAPTVVPTVRGGLQLEWHRQGVDLEVEFEPNGTTSWYAEDLRTEEAVEAKLDEDVGLWQWLNRASG